MYRVNVSNSQKAFIFLQIHPASSIYINTISPCLLLSLTLILTFIIHVSRTTKKSTKSKCI